VKPGGASRAKYLLALSGIIARTLSNFSAIHGLSPAAYAPSRQGEAGYDMPTVALRYPVLLLQVTNAAELGGPRAFGAREA